MHEDILNGNYSDPMEMDDFAVNRVNDYETQVNKLAGKLISESELKYYRKKKKLNTTEDETQNSKYPAKRHYRRLDHIAEPWDVKTNEYGDEDDQAFCWPDYEAESFEKALEQFRQRPESNTGYTNKALNKKEIEIFGDQAKKCIDNKLFESKKQFTGNKLTESEGSLDMAKAYSEAEVFCEVADMFGDDKAAVAKLRSAYKRFKFEDITCSEMLEAMDQYLKIATAHGETSTTAELVQISRLFALHAELNYKDVITHPEAILENSKHENLKESEEAETKKTGKEPVKNVAVDVFYNNNVACASRGADSDEPNKHLKFNTLGKGVDLCIATIVLEKIYDYESLEDICEALEVENKKEITLDVLTDWLDNVDYTGGDPVVFSIEIDGEKVYDGGLDPEEWEPAGWDDEAKEDAYDEISDALIDDYDGSAEDVDTDSIYSDVCSAWKDWSKKHDPDNYDIDDFADSFLKKHSINDYVEDDEDEEDDE